MTWEAGIGFYAGFPIRLSDGSVYGTLCRLGYTPDSWLRSRDPRLMGEPVRGLAVRLERGGLL